MGVRIPTVITHGLIHRDAPPLSYPSGSGLGWVLPIVVYTMSSSGGEPQRKECTPIVARISIPSAFYRKPLFCRHSTRIRCKCFLSVWKHREAFCDRGSPYCFWNPSLKELPTSLGNGLQRKSNCTPMNNPMAQVYKNVIFRNNIDISTILG